VRVGSGHHAASPPVDSFRPDAASLNDRFRLGAVGQVAASTVGGCRYPTLGDGATNRSRLAGSSQQRATGCARPMTRGYTRRADRGRTGAWLTAEQFTERAPTLHTTEQPGAGFHRTKMRVINTERACAWNGCSPIPLRRRLQLSGAIFKGRRSRHLSWALSSLRFPASTFSGVPGGSV
jgi:hypothetical protein